MSKIKLDTLILYDNIRRDEAVNAAVRIFNELEDRRPVSGPEDHKSASDPEDHKPVSDLEKDYYQAQRSLLETADRLDMDGTYWENHICRLVAEGENRFSLMSEKGEVDENICSLAIREAAQLKKLYSLEWPRIDSLFHENAQSVCAMKQNPADKTRKSQRQPVKEALEAASPEEAVRKLTAYYRDYGCGIFERYQAFLWDEALVGVANYDRITFDQLIGYERQKETLIENTEFFLKGYPANNALLHGDRGTGKSSCVKALLNKFKDGRLKLISLNKSHVGQLYRIMEIIADRGCKFIIFIDDLSFEDTEIGYKHFKSVIDGGIEAQPSNVLIYVTSNRRNIIRETWKDRGENSEVHAGDGMQERLSLADRFGLSIPFPSPDRAVFLEIVKGIAKQEGLEVDESVLMEEALRWDVRQKGRSGRSARQFVNYIHGKTLKENE